MEMRIAKCRQRYAGRIIEAGEEFELQVVPGEDMAAHIRLLLVLERIEPKRGEPGYVSPKQKKYEARAA